MNGIYLIFLIISQFATPVNCPFISLVRLVEISGSWKYNLFSRMKYPWTVSNWQPASVRSFAYCKVFSSSLNTRILQVTGTLRLLWRIRTAIILRCCLRNEDVEYPVNKWDPYFPSEMNHNFLFSLSVVGSPSWYQLHHNSLLPSLLIWGDFPDCSHKTGSNESWINNMTTWTISGLSKGAVEKNFLRYVLSRK